MRSLTNTRTWFMCYSKKCNISKEEFENTDDKSYYRVRNHCHYTGRYKGDTHNICNLRYKIPQAKI